MSQQAIQQLLKSHSGKSLTNGEFDEIISKVIACYRQTLGVTSFLNVKYDFNAFLDSLSLELRQRSIDRVYTELGVKSNQDTHYLRPKMEELFKEGLGTSPTYPTANY